MKDEAKKPDRRLDQQVPPQEVPQPSAVSRHQPGPERHAAHEDRQHQGLGVGRMPKEEFQIVRPDGFVYESGEHGDYEYAEQETSFHTIRICHHQKYFGPGRLWPFYVTTPSWLVKPITNCLGKTGIVAAYIQVALRPRGVNSLLTP